MNVLQSSKNTIILLNTLQKYFLKFSLRSKRWDPVLLKFQTKM